MFLYLRNLKESSIITHDTPKIELVKNEADAQAEQLIIWSSKSFQIHKWNEKKVSNFTAIV